MLTVADALKQTEEPIENLGKLIRSDNFRTKVLTKLGLIPERETHDEQRTSEILAKFPGMSYQGAALKFNRQCRLAEGLGFRSISALDMCEMLTGTRPERLFMGNSGYGRLPTAPSQYGHGTEADWFWNGERELGKRDHDPLMRIVAPRIHPLPHSVSDMEHIGLGTHPPGWPETFWPWDDEVDLILAPASGLSRTIPYGILLLMSEARDSQIFNTTQAVAPVKDWKAMSGDPVIVASIYNLQYQPTSFDDWTGQRHYFLGQWD